MSEHLSQQLFERFRARQDSEADRSVAQAHTSECDSCRDRLWAATNLPDAIGSLRKTFEDASRNDPHLNIVQLRAYATDKLDEIDRELADIHMASCRSCSAAMIAMNADATMAAVMPLKQVIERGRVNRRGTMTRAAGWILAACLLIATLLTVLVFFANRRSLDQQSLSSKSPRTDLNPVDTNNDENPPATIPQIESTDKNEVQQQAHSDVSSSSGAAGHAQGEGAPHTLRRRETQSDGNTSIRRGSTGRSNSTGQDDVGLAKVVADSLRSGSLTYPSNLLSLKRRANVTLKGSTEDAEFDLTSPVGVVVMKDRPEFEWEEVPRAQYRVLVGDRNNKLIAESGTLTAPRWTPPAPLPRGKMLRWQVVAMTDGNQYMAPSQARGDVFFSILPADDLAQVRRYVDKSGADHLALGVVYASKGLLELAEREFMLVPGNHPRSELTLKFLEDVRRKRLDNSGRDQ